MRIFLYIVLLWISPHLLQAASYNPSIQWMQQETEHFIIIYNTKHALLADTTAAIAERMYDSVTVLLRHEPPIKTALILSDHSDAIEAYTMMYWYPHIVITPAPVTPKDIHGASARWLDLVIAHEFTHIVQQDMTGGIFGMLRDVFGRLFYNNSWQPYWAIEGPAVYAESKFTQAGRVQGGIYDMMLRTAVRDDCLLRIDQIANYSLIRWPAGGASYVYGTALMQELTKGTHGTDAIADFNHRYKQRLLPLFNTTFSLTSGQKATNFFQTWRRGERTRQRTILAKIKAKGETPLTLLTSRGYMCESPTWFPNSSVLAYTCATKNLHPQLRVYNIQTKRDTRVCTFINQRTQSTAAVSPDGTQLAYTELIPQNLYTNYNELYIFNIKTHNTTRLTEGGRAHAPSWSPDGHTLVYVAKKATGSNLHTIRDNGDAITALTNRDDCVFSHPAWSPEGNRIISSLTWKNKTYLCLYDFRSPDSLTLLTDGSSLDIDPSWSPDGKYIVFSSNRDGVFNLYALYLHAGSLNRITNLSGGAFSPTVSPDGSSIAFSNYSSTGYDLAVMKIQDGCADKIIDYTPSHKRLPCQQTPLAQASRTPSRPYSAWQTFLPQSWYPLLYSDGNAAYIGFGSLGSDVLQRHILAGNIALAPTYNQIGYTLFYAYQRFHPTWYLNMHRDTRTQSDTLLERTDTYQAGLTLPGIGGALNNIFHTSATMELSHTHTSILDTHSYHTIEPSSHYNSIAGNISLSSYDYYKASISPERGIIWHAQGEGTDQSWGSTHSYYSLHTQLNLYLPGLFTHHVLAPSAGWFKRSGDTYWRDLGTGELFFGTLEYRLPLLYPESGFRTWPIFIRKTSAHLFVAVAGHPQYQAAEPLSYGINLNLFTTLWHAAETVLTLNVNFIPHAAGQISINLNIPFNHTYTKTHTIKEQHSWDLQNKLLKIQKKL